MRELPQWVSIYFMEILDKDMMKCNLCDMEFEMDNKSPTLKDHLKLVHTDVYELHRQNPQATIGFRIGLDGEIDKSQPIVLCDDKAETLMAVESVQTEESDVISMQYVMLDTKRKHRKSSGHEARKRSWIWKYFNRLSNIVYRCNLCNVVLSTKGSNTNNLNRHMRSKHNEIYQGETIGEKDKDAADMASDGITPYAIQTEEIYASNKDGESPLQKTRRSWIWSYFEYVTPTQAQCKLCRRHINHGGNATGNMNRHLKMIHHKTADEKCDNTWIWKVFQCESKHYSCKICQYKVNKNNNVNDISAITAHLKKSHGVISGDQIITGPDEIELDEQ